LIAAPLVVGLVDLLHPLGEEVAQLGEVRSLRADGAGLQAAEVAGVARVGADERAPHLLRLDGGGQRPRLQGDVLPGRFGGGRAPGATAGARRTLSARIAADGVRAEQALGRSPRRSVAAAHLLS